MDVRHEIATSARRLLAMTASAIIANAVMASAIPIPR
jgi:hypothetical protein